MSKPKTEDVDFSVPNMWGVFDSDDLCDGDPQPCALFNSEEEAKGFVLLACSGSPCFEAVVRPCKVDGSVTVEVEDEEVAPPASGG